MNRTATQARPLPGTAQHVIAHAASRALVGLPPVLPYLFETDPHKALRLARDVATGQSLSRRVQSVIAQVLAHKPYTEMSDAELRVAVREIVKTSYCRKQVQRRVREEMGCPYEVWLSIEKPQQGAAGNEAREILLLLGCIVMAHGAVATGGINVNGRRIKL